jgi:multidrug efflux pump subunit AcrA (membrane-fusion protein)
MKIQLLSLNIKGILDKFPPWIKILLILLVVIGIFVFLKKPKDNNQAVINVKHGPFKVIVSAVGELSSSNSTKITLPIFEMQSIGLFELTVTRLVPEGTIVDSGDFIIEFDKSSLLTKLNDIENDIKKAIAAFEGEKLDTSLNLSDAREKELDLKNAVTDAQYAFDQSQYESPAAIRQAKNALEKAKRELDRGLKKYKQLQVQSNTNVDNKYSELQIANKKKNDLQKVLEKLTIHSMAKGMVVFERDFDGSRKNVGSKINIFTNQAIANIPNLKSLTSRAYVNEMEVNKVQPGQKVSIIVDAFMNKTYNGTVTNVANIGQPLPGHDANVFEINIAVENTDMKLKPSMRTNNFILTSSIPDALYVPIDAVQSNDTVSYVYLVKGSHIIKKQIKTGPFNDNDIIIEQGLKTEDKILLSFPSNDDNLPFYALK